MAGMGAVGIRAARQLAASAGVDRIDVVDPGGRVDLDRIAASLGERVHPSDVVRAAAAVVVLAGPPPHAATAAAHLAAGRVVVSVSDDPDDVDDLLGLDAAACAAGRPLVVGAGFAPGFSGLLARHGARGLDSLDEVHVAVHGTGGPACARQHHHALAGRSLAWLDGAWEERPGGSGRELCWFPEPVGAHDCYRASLSDPLLLHRAFPEAERISARVSATRRDRLTARLPMLRKPHPEGLLGGVRVEVRGTRGGARVVEVLGAVDRPAGAAGAVAAVAALAAAAGRLGPGARGLADAEVPTGELLADLAARGIKGARFVGSGATA